MTMYAIITGYGGPAVRADTLQLIGSGFGRVSSAALVDTNGNGFEVHHHVDHGGSVTITIPQLLPDGTYIPVLGTLDNIDSQNLAGPITLSNLAVAPPPRAPDPDPVPFADSPALAAIRQRLRLEIGDFEAPFQVVLQSDGFTRRFDLPVEVVTPAGLSVMAQDELPGGGYSAPAVIPASAYELDARAGVLTLDAPLPNDSLLTVTGTNHQFFSDAELSIFIRSAALKHTKGAEDLQVYRDARGFRRFLYSNETVDTIAPVEHHAVALLAATEALEVVRTDTAYDIDVVTADGTSLPRGERFRNIGELIAEKRMVYDDLCRNLGVGLNRIEVTNMRRVSRTTGRLVPNYVSREFDDRRPVAPLRIFAPRNLGAIGPGAFTQRETYRYGAPLPPYGPLEGEQNTPMGDGGPA